MPLHDVLIGNTAWHCQAARSCSRRRCWSLAPGTAAAGAVYSTSGPWLPPSTAWGNASMELRGRAGVCTDPLHAGLSWGGTTKTHHQDAPSLGEIQDAGELLDTVKAGYGERAGPRCQNNLGSRSIASREQVGKKLFLFLDLTYYISIMPSRSHHVVSNGKISFSMCIIYHSACVCTHVYLCTCIYCP